MGIKKRLLPSESFTETHLHMRIKQSPSAAGSEICVLPTLLVSLISMTVRFQEHTGSYRKRKIDNYDLITHQNIGAALTVTGVLALTPGSKQPFELKAASVEIAGTSTPDYPLQPKRHSPEFLRSVAHLRPRTNTYSAVFRVRSVAAQAIHEFLLRTISFT